VTSEATRLEDDRFQSLVGKTIITSEPFHIWAVNAGTSGTGLEYKSGKCLFVVGVSTVQRKWAGREVDGASSRTYGTELGVEKYIFVTGFSTNIMCIAVVFDVHNLPDSFAVIQ